MGWFVIITGIVVVWAWRAYFRPFAPCRWCKGRKTSRGSTPKRFGLCWRCKGSGSRQVLGSKQVHKAVAAIRGRP
jgi:hypothetical protein